MYAAELHGKLPSQVARLEDVLTSHVFGFLKYADRSRYLAAFLTECRVRFEPDELDEVELRFWPRFDDNTEPDVVVVTRRTYIVVEAKLHSDFGKDAADPCETRWLASYAWARRRPEPSVSTSFS